MRVVLWHRTRNRCRARAVANFSRWWKWLETRVTAILHEFLNAGWSRFLFFLHSSLPLLLLLCGCYVVIEEGNNCMRPVVIDWKHTYDNLISWRLKHSVKRFEKSWLRRTLSTTELRRNISEACKDRFCTTVTEITDVKDTTAFMNQTFEELRTKCEDVVGKKAKFGKRNRKSADDNNKLGLQVLQLYQNSRTNNLEISGVANTPNEELLDLLSTTGGSVSSPVGRVHNIVTHRVLTPGKPVASTIIVRFVSTDKTNIRRIARKVRLTKIIMGLSNESHLLFLLWLRQPSWGMSTPCPRNRADLRVSERASRYMLFSWTPLRNKQLILTVFQWPPESRKQSVIC